MKHTFGFFWMLLPFSILLVLAGFLLTERSGMVYQITYPPMQFLRPAQMEPNPEFDNRPAQALVLYDSQGFAGDEHVQTVQDALDSMRVKYDTFDIRSDKAFNLKEYQIVVVALLEWEAIGSPLFEILRWVEYDGGRVLFSIRPDPSEYFSAIYRKLGIVSKGDDFVIARGVTFMTNLLPGAQGLSLGEDFLLHSSYPLSLDSRSRLHAASADEYQTPLIWEYDLGKGRLVFINSDQFNTKSSRGILGASYSLLADVLVYPVINSSIFFIDDFPSPIREGSDPVITEQFGRDIQSFFINVWWPDLDRIAREHGIRYTGVIVETYNDTIVPPFEKQPEIERHQYFGGLVLNNGGELGLHGYNHVPLCLEQSGVNQRLDYPGWESTEAMELAMYELYSFSRNLFPENEFVTYVPASNILCPEARSLLPKILPDLRVIASVYLPDEDDLAYEQEFIEAADGIIEFPRIIAGYEITDYMWWVAVNELGLHYVNSHFVHPDDVLAEDRGAQKGWDYLQTQFNTYVAWLSEAAPGLRNMTAQEGAMAVQRFSRLDVKTEISNGLCRVSLDNFYDEAWLMLRTSKRPLSIQGGEITPVSSGLYLIKALQSQVVIQFGE